MNEQLKCLIELQELDSAIISIEEKNNALPEKLKQFQTPLEEATELFQKKKAKYDALVKKKKDKDLKLDEIQDTIEKLRAKGSNIKTNKEYEAHLKEIEVFENKISGIEDEILVIMEEIEAFEKELKDEEVKLRKAEDAFKEQEKIFDEEGEKLAQQLEAEKAKRKEFASNIDKKNYTHYINIMKRFGDRAVVETRNEICLGCNTNIPPQLFNDIKRNKDIYHCFYCQRILYFKEPPSPDKQSQETSPAS